MELIDETVRELPADAWVSNTLAVARRAGVVDRYDKVMANEIAKSLRAHGWAFKTAVIKGKKNPVKVWKKVSDG